MNGKREKIVAATRNLIQYYGIKKTNIEDIAESCGMAKATLYHYFTNKDEIIKEVIIYENVKFKKKLKKVVEKETELEKKLLKYLELRLSHFSNLKKCYKYFLKEFYSRQYSIEKIREEFYSFEENYLSELLRSSVNHSKSLEGVLRVLILGYESQIIQGKKYEEIQRNLSSHIDGLFHFTLNKTDIKEDL